MHIAYILKYDFRYNNIHAKLLARSLAESTLIYLNQSRKLNFFLV